jgi:hypothetical protein
MNSCKHGLTAQSVVIGGENPNDFEDIRSGFEKDFVPRSSLERELVERLAGLSWRLRRIPVFEAAAIRLPRRDVQATEPGYPVALRAPEELRDQFIKWIEEEREECWSQYRLKGSPEVTQDAKIMTKIERDPEVERLKELGLALTRDDRLHDVLSKLSRHETALMNAFMKTLRMLLLLQSNRHNEKDEVVNLAL